MRPPPFDPFEAAQWGAFCGCLLSLGLLVIGILHNPYGWKPLAIMGLGAVAGWIGAVLYEEAYWAEERRREKKK